MADRNEITLRYKVGRRFVEVKAYDSVGVEDAYSVQLKAVLHRYATGEDHLMPVPREVKDWMIRTNLFV